MHKRADARKAPRQDTFPQWCICLDVASETTIHVNELLLALKVRAFRQEEEGGKGGNKNSEEHADSNCHFPNFPNVDPARLQTSKQ